LQYFHIELCNASFSQNQAILKCFVSILFENRVIRQNKIPHEELGRHIMKIQDATEDIRSWENSIPSSKTSLEKENTQKDEEKGKQSRSHAPRVCETVLQSTIFSTQV